jgi:6-phosphogluconolactonase (cycloisomerase 2 family)
MLSPSGRQLPAATGDIGFDPLGRFAYALATATGSVTTLGLGSSQTSRGVTIVDRAPSGWSSERIEIATGLAPAVTTSKLLLVTDFVRDVLDAYRIDPNDGTLTHVGDARTGGSGASWLAVSPDGRFAYVASSSSDTVGAFKVDPDSGAITAVGSQLALPGHPCRLVVDRATSSLIALVLAPAEIAFFPIDRTTGALSPVALEQPTSISSPSWLAVSNLGDAVLVADSQGAGQVDELPLRPQSAFQPRLLGPSFSWFPGTGTGHHTTGAIFDPFDHGVVAWGDRFVVWQNAGPSLTGPAGVLNPALPVSVVAAAPDGDALFSIFRDSSGAKVADVAIDPSTGAAHFIRYEIPFDASIKTPTAAVADASGHWFYVLDRDTRKIALFDRDTASGALQQQATIGIQGTSKQTVLVPRTSFSLRSMPIDMQIVDVTN